VIADALHLLRCPHCGAGLARADATVRCSGGHSFDLARQGYLSLLPGGGPAFAGDTAGMVDARERFLGAGHFGPLVAALGEACERAGAADGCIVDLGAGTGHYLAEALGRLPDRAGLALDVSKAALRRAARAHPRVAAVGCDAWGPLPIRDGVAAAVLNVFAPRNPPEMARVLGQGGVALIVTPTARHLGELVEPLGLIGVDERKEERLGEQLAPHLELVDRRELGWPLRLDRASARDAAAMGPSAFHVRPEALEERIAALPEQLDVTAEVTLWVAAA
jgi:23S rRNA (guanine745-N1)-methyltransferase